MNVLIVEDDNIISVVLSKMVENLGFNVLGIQREGKTAIDAIFTLQPDVVLMDIHLNDATNGIEVMKSIREKSVKVPVIFVSGNSYLKEEAHELKCIDFVSKPFTMDDLKKAFQKYLKQVRSGCNC